jgi:hypothetical protein
MQFPASQKRAKDTNTSFSLCVEKLFCLIGVAFCFLSAVIMPIDCFILEGAGDHG